MKIRDWISRSIQGWKTTPTLTRSSVPSMLPTTMVPYVDDELTLALIERGQAWRDAKDHELEFKKIQSLEEEWYRKTTYLNQRYAKANKRVMDIIDRRSGKS